MPIIVFQHSEIGGPGRFGRTLRDHGQRLDIRRLDLSAAEGGGVIPADFDGVDGVISLGGPQNVGDNQPWIEDEVRFLRGAHDRQLPVVGICLGAQLLARALGAPVEKMQAPEWGFCPVDQTVPGNTDTILAGVPWHSTMFQSHGWKIAAAPPGALVLQESAAAPVQAFRAGLRSYGFQYHFEADGPMIELMAKWDTSGHMAAAGASRGDLPELMQRHYPVFSRLADRLSLNFATFLFLAHRPVLA